MNDLDTLRPEVAQALGFIERNQKYGDGSVCAGDIDIVRAELLRLAMIETDALIALDCEHDWQVMRERAEKAEAELAALKARILPGAAKVEIADTDDPDGNPYGWVGGTLLSHNLIGKRVRLVVEE